MHARFDCTVIVGAAYSTAGPPFRYKKLENAVLLLPGDRTRFEYFLKTVKANCILVCTSLLATPCAGIAQSENPDPIAPPSVPPIGQSDRELPPNMNDFLPAQRRDRLDKSLMRLASVAMKTDLSENEPWLYDRATTYYKLSVWSGEEKFREHAMTLLDTYYSLIDERGEFRLKPGDPKYSYVDGAVWYEFATGDQRYRAAAGAVYELWLNELPSAYSETQNFWTERQIAFALGAALGWYELTGDDAALGRADALVRQWRDMSESSGAPLHTLAQHQEEFEPPWGDKRMTSPWMAAFFFEYLQHYYRLTQNPAALQLVSSYADFLLANCLYDGSVNHRNLAGYMLPYYLCGEGGTFYERETPSEGDGEHTPDVMGIMAFAVSAKRQLGLDAEPALRAYRELRSSAKYFVGRRSNVSPPRKISWWFATSYDSTLLVE